MTAYVWPLIIHSAEAPWRSSQKKKLRPKDSALSLQKFRPLLWPEFDLWPGDFCLLWVEREKIKDLRSKTIL